MNRQRSITILTPTAMEIEAVAASAASYGANVVVSGVGTVETAAALCRLYAKGNLGDTVILAGIAGAYPGSGLAPGDTAVAVSETVADLGAVRDGTFVPLYEKTYKCPYVDAVKSIRKARFATVNCVNGLQATGLDHELENMEGAAFFAVCTALNITFLEVRAVSNLTTDKRNIWQIPLALEALGQAVNAVIKETE